MTLEDVGFTLKPARTYAVTVDAATTAADGQTLGYAWTGSVENWHQRAFTSFGAGHGVWEKSGGPQLPFYARNLVDRHAVARARSPSTTSCPPCARCRRSRSC